MPFDAFLKLDGIKGESNDAKHPGEIEIQSFHWGVANSGTLGGGGGGAGVTTRQDFLFTAGSSGASPQLFLACATGQHIKEGLLTLRSAGGQQTDFSTIRLSDLTIAAYDQAGSDDASAPMDEFALRYAKIEFTYNGVKTGFDFLKNVKI